MPFKFRQRRWGQHLLECFSESLDISVAMMEIVNDADVSMAGIVKRLAHGNKVLRLPSPTAVIVEPKSATELLCSLRKNTETGLQQFARLRLEIQDSATAASPRFAAADRVFQNKANAVSCALQKATNSISCLRY